MDNGPPAPTDQELLRRARSGDSRAFHELVDRHAAGVYRLAVSLVGADDAEDVLQETFAGAWRGLAGFRHECSVKTWLSQILVRQAAMSRRAAARRKVLSLDQELSDPPQAPRQARPDVRIDLERAIAALQLEHRQVIVLRELEGLSYDQIAQVLQVPRGTVESRLFRARQRMQELLKDYFS